MASKLTSLYLILAALATRYRNWKSSRRIYLSLLTEGHLADDLSELAFKHAFNFEAVKFGSPIVSIASLVLASSSCFNWQYWDVSLLGVYLIRAICFFLILCTLSMLSPVSLLTKDGHSLDSAALLSDKFKRATTSRSFLLALISLHLNLRVL